MVAVVTRDLRPGDRLGDTGLSVIPGSVVTSIVQPEDGAYVVNFANEYAYWSFYDGSGDRMWEIERAVAPEEATREIIGWL